MAGSEDWSSGRESVCQLDPGACEDNGDITCEFSSLEAAGDDCITTVSSTTTVLPGTTTTAEVQVLPQGQLPVTGGDALSLMIFGTAAILAGVTTLRKSRRIR